MFLPMKNKQRLCHFLPPHVEIEKWMWKNVFINSDKEDVNQLKINEIMKFFKVFISRI